MFENINHLQETTINHVAIIADGHRRWAKQNGLHKADGHKKGILVNAPAWVDYLFNKKINTVTLWLFSTTNWKRDKDEIDHLMEIFSELCDISEELADSHKAKVIHMGRKNYLPTKLANKISRLEQHTSSNSDHVLFLAIDYCGPDEVVRAIQQIINDEVKAVQITEELINKYLDTKSSKYSSPDLIINLSLM